MINILGYKREVRINETFLKVSNFKRSWIADIVTNWTNSGFQLEEEHERGQPEYRIAVIASTSLGMQLEILGDIDYDYVVISARALLRGRRCLHSS
jgi:hypothetical protein